MARIPVTILTGFLGSGKTTLLNHMLQHPSLAESAVTLQQKRNIKLVMKEGRIYADRRRGGTKKVVNVKPGEWKIIDYL